MTPEAKRALSATIRGLRAHLLDALHSATEQRYLLSIEDPDAAGLDEVRRLERRHFEGWVSDQLRTARARPVRGPLWDRFRREAEKQAAYFLLNRLVLLRLLEASRLRRVPVVTGGRRSRGYQQFRELAPSLVGDATEGYELLLQLVFEDLAGALPGLYGDAGVARLVPLAGVLHHVVDTLDDPELADCWTDDMTLGWVYQYWNDPEREELDAKLHARGKIEPHEIASKTQMFTERYMVDWLLQNSLGPLWLAICGRRGWTPDAVARGTLARLAARRADWRARRESGAVALTDLMPLHGDDERRWAYYVDQPTPADAAIVDSVRDIKILDPAVGSGHFLVVAFDLLLALHEEEARHRGEQDLPQWSRRAIVEHIVEHNLHGLDIDPRAVQIAAAALWLKARTACPEARPRRMNLVASDLRLTRLPDDDPALESLRRALAREADIPIDLIDTLVHGLRGADHLGSLLRIDDTINKALDRYDQDPDPRNLSLPHVDPDAPAPAPLIDRAAAHRTFLELLESFLKRHTTHHDLGLRLHGEQLASGVRFVRILRENFYHLVVGNPPYQGTTRMADVAYVQEHYERGKADLYAAFLERGLQLVRPGGVSALLTMRNWMFIKQYADLREFLLANHDLRALGDFAIGAFDEVPNDVLSVTVSVFHKTATRPDKSIAQQPTPPDDRSYDRARTNRKRAATLAGEGRVEFKQHAIRAIPEWPLVYTWTESFLRRYSETPRFGDVAPARLGLGTRDDTRFLRRWHEASLSSLYVHLYDCGLAPMATRRWAPVIIGAKTQMWIEPLANIVRWQANAYELNVWIEHYRLRAPGGYMRNLHLNFVRGVAFTPIGQDFTARAHRFRSVFHQSGASIFPKDTANALCVLNSSISRKTISTLNPGMHFELGDVDRLPMLQIPGAQEIFETVERAFGEHESHREASVEYRRPGPSPWRHAQVWAQQAVDRPEGAPLPDYAAEHDREPPTDHVSHALGVALGRFGRDGEGVLDPARDDLGHALPAGILFLDGTLAPHDHGDGLGHPAAAPLHAAWAEHGAAIAPDTPLRAWLAADFFEIHRKQYDSRPIHWPLSSEKRTFVAWVTIHRWTVHTLRTLQIDHLQPTLKRLDGELADLRAVRAGADKKAAKAAEKRLAPLLKWREELAAFIAAVAECGERGPPPTDAKCPPRAADAPYAPDLDDGVMLNSAALWPLLAPQWKDPKKWWKELATGDDKKHYDWAHLAMRHWPARVDARCRVDPSLAVAHGCFWRYHPARALAWELRLQDEIGPEFVLTEAPYRGEGGDAVHRADFLATRGDEAVRLIQAELLRRVRKRGPLAEYHLQFPDLWTRHPDACWALEDAVIRKQKLPFVLRAADEPAARRAFVAADPDADKRRTQLLNLVAQQRSSLFTDPEEPGDEPDDQGDDPETDA